MKLIRMADVVQKVGISRSAVYALIARNEFPRPAKVGKMSCWPEDAIDAWIKAQVSRQLGVSPAKGEAA